MDSTDKTVPARKYTNVFTRYGYSEQVIQTRAAEIWDAIFTGPYKIYTEVPPDMAYIEDVGNADVRTEGMSYGMMLAVQYDRHDVFDKLWRWVMKYM